MTSYEAQATPTVNIQRKFGEKGHVAFDMCEQTDRQTDMLITILRTPPGEEAMYNTHKPD